MICPHCQTSLRYRERPGRRCSTCQRHFALEPRESPFRMHDLRVHRLAEKLGDGRQLRYTGPQLYYAAGRRELPSVTRWYEVAAGVVSGVILVGTLILTVILVRPFWLGLIALPVLLIAANVALYLALPVFTRRTRVRMRVAYPSFSSKVIRPWQLLYRDLPPGMADHHAPLPVVPRPRMALLCPDSAALACLAANGAATTWQLALCGRPDQVPPGVPVLVLHDASAAGLTWARHVRDTLGARAVPIGLFPARARTAAWAVRLRELPEGTPELPPALSEPDREWLADGWYTPLAAVPPARLLTLVERGVDRVAEAADPDRKAAAGVGFLTWPSPA